LTNGVLRRQNEGDQGEKHDRQPLEGRWEQNPGKQRGHEYGFFGRVDSFIGERRKTLKKTCAFLSILLLMTAAAVAAGGPVEGKKFEFSTGFAFSIQKYNYGHGYKETYTVFQMPFRLGIFFAKGLEFEPELLLTSEHSKYSSSMGSYSYSSTGWILSGNLVYNFKLKSPRMIPFVLAGYGFGNGDLEGTDVDEYAGGDVSSPKTSLFNAGAGFKYLFGNIAALRFEYRLRTGTVKYTSEGTFSDKVNFHSFLLGLSLFF
jgi:opacity protein-like surface antigen